jgi:hypothetical protein
VVLALIATVGTVAIVGVTAFAATPRTDHSNLSAVDGAGKNLGDNPLVKPGEVVVVTARGFAPGVPVDVRSPELAMVSELTSDQTGAAVLRFALPSTLAHGKHQILFAGAPGASSPSASTTTGDAGAGAANVVVTVPLVEGFRFHTGPGAGIAGESAGPDSNGGGDLAHTGTDIRGQVVAALLAVLAGVGVVVFMRRSRSRGGAARALPAMLIAWPGSVLRQRQARRVHADRRTRKTDSE